MLKSNVTVSPGTENCNQSTPRLGNNKPVLKVSGCPALAKTTGSRSNNLTGKWAAKTHGSLLFYGINYCMFEFKYLCKISIVNCSNGARRVPTIFAPDIVFKSVVISLQLISRSSSLLSDCRDLLESGVKEMIALHFSQYRSFCCNTGCEIKRCKQNLGSPRKLQSLIFSSTTGNPQPQT